MRTLLLLLLTFTIACGGRQTIPERKLVKILAEMHLVDAALEQSGGFQGSGKMRDSTTVYTAILDEHGYTVAQLYGSMSKYSSTKDAADKLYDKVCRQLSKLQKQYAKEVEKLHDEQNRWTQKSDWRFPNDGDTSRLAFAIPVSDSVGSYVLTADITLPTTDSVSNPRMTMYLYAQNCRMDSVLRDSVRVDTLVCFDSLIAQREQPITRDGKEQKYTLTLENTSAHSTLVRGYILNCDCDSLSVKPRQATVRNVMLRYVTPAESPNRKSGNLKFQIQNSELLKPNSRVR